MSVKSDLEAYLIAPDPGNARLTRAVTGRDHQGDETTINVVEERPLTIFLNAQEIVTAMTIGDYPEYLALGFLRNQGMLRDSDQITGVEYDDDLEVVVVRTARKTDYEDKMRKKTRTSGCAVGTVFGDMMEGLEGVTLPATPVHTSWLYTTGRLTSEMVIKTAMMGIPVLASRSGFTAWGVEIAQSVGLTLIGRMRGKRFVCLAGEDRLVRDADPDAVQDEPRRSGRKGAA